MVTIGFSSGKSEDLPTKTLGFKAQEYVPIKKHFTYVVAVSYDRIDCALCVREFSEAGAWYCPKSIQCTLSLFNPPALYPFSVINLAVRISAADSCQSLY